MLGFASGANAQIFCPPSVPGNPGINLQGGFCTSGNTGALSTAALSAESLSEVTEPQLSSQLPRHSKRSKSAETKSRNGVLMGLSAQAGAAAGSPRSRWSLCQKGRRDRRCRQLRSLQLSGKRPRNPTNRSRVSDGRQGSSGPRKRQVSNDRSNRLGEK
jgi:hypothetical protein